MSEPIPDRRGAARTRPATRDRRGWRTRLLFVLGGTIAAMLSAELLLRVLGYDHHYVNGTASFHEFAPELGLRGKPGFAARFVQPDFDVGVALDARGFRRMETPTPEGDAPRLFALGDSFTWGWGVDQGEPFPDLLARAMPDVEVRNLGLSGTGTVIQYLIFRREVLPVLRAGDTVLLAVYENDLPDNLGERMEEWAHARVVDGEVELVSPPPPSLRVEIKNVLKDRSYLFNLIAFLADRYQIGRRSARAEAAARAHYDSVARGETDASEPGVDLPDDAEEVTVLRHHLAALRDDVAGVPGAHLVVVAIPGRSALDEGVDDADQRPFELARYRAILRTARALGLPVLDLLGPLARQKRERGIPRISHPHDFHWNRDGHRIAAAEIERFLHGR